MTLTRVALHKLDLRATRFRRSAHSDCTLTGAAYSFGHPSNRRKSHRQVNPRLKWKITVKQRFIRCRRDFKHILSLGTSFWGTGRGISASCCSVKSKNLRPFKSQLIKGRTNSDYLNRRPCVIACTPRITKGPRDQVSHMRR